MSSLVGAPEWRRRGAEMIVGAGDLVALVIAIWLTGVNRWVGVLVGALVIVVNLSASGYRQTLVLSALGDTPAVVRRVAVAVLIASPVLLASGEARDGLVVALGAAVAVPIGRGVSYGVVRSLRRRGPLSTRTAIIGAGDVGQQVFEQLARVPSLGLRPIGFIDEDDPHERALLGSLSEIDAVVEEHRIGVLVVAFGLFDSSQLVRALRRLGESDVRVFLVPRFFEVGVSPRTALSDEIGGIPVMRLRRAAMTRPAWILKRSTDVVVSAALMVLLAPLFGILALLVRWSSPGPVMFLQKREGRDGVKFSVSKFRTLRMPTGEPWNAPGLDPQEAHHLREQDALARQTRVGAFLRRSGLDELPQLWNVLKGEMSLVGPRPEQTDLADQFAIGLQGYTERSRLPPGITGWAQVQGYRGDTDLAGRVRLDNDYIENWSLWRDVVILARTAGTIVRAAFERPGADRAEESR